MRTAWRLSIFQSTPPHGERHGVAYHDDSQIVFQSTLPAWGATFFFACSECFFNISIHTPRMGSDHPYLHVDQVQHISIHAPRMGSDPPIRAKMTTSHIFQSTPPHGERLTCFLIKAGLINFNPRPRMGSDHHRFGYIPRRSYFNPRPPHGERRQYSQRSRPSDIFQSTLPHGERRANPVIASFLLPFQSTLPHGERRAHFMSI